MTKAPPPPINKTCANCGKAFTLEFPSLAAYVNTCPECAEREAVAHGQALIARSLATCPNESRWHALCPPEFRYTERHRLPSPTRLDAVLRWTYGKKGLVLHGDTGAG